MIDVLDAKIIDLLQSDGRQRNTEIARKLGVTEGTVRNRIERLLREKVIQVGAWADPLRVGYQTYAVIQIHVTPAEIETVADALAKFPEILLLGLCTGEFDITAWSLFGSHDHLYEFLTKRLSQVPGIQRTATSSIIRIIKREWATPLVGAHLSLDEAGRFRTTASRTNKKRQGVRGRRTRAGNPLRSQMQRRKPQQMPVKSD